MFSFHCKVCSEKQSRINDLKNEITYLREMVFSQNSEATAPSNVREADYILSGEQLPQVITEEQFNEQEALLNGE